jgi:hypothetical protein
MKAPSHNPPRGTRYAKDGLERRAEVSSTAKFLAASREFCFQHNLIRQMKKAAKACTEKDRVDPAFGDMGQGPCDICDPSASRCDECESRAAARPAYLAAMKRRSNAKRKMLRWERKIERAADCAAEMPGAEGSERAHQ